MFKRCFHFISDDMFNLYVNGEYVNKCDKGSSIDLIVTSKSFNYMLCPISDKTLVVDSGVVVNESVVNVTSPNLKVIPFTNNHYNLYYKPIIIHNLSQNVSVLEKSCNGTNFYIYNNPVGIIEIFGKDNKKYKKQLDMKILVSNIESVGKYIVITSVLENNKRHVVAVSNDNKVCFDEIGDDIEISENDIKVLIDYKNINSTAKIICYNLLSEEKTDYLTYLENRNLNLKDEGVAYAFLQSLKIKDFNFAKSLLSEAFGSVDNIQLENFFGEVKNFYYNNYLVGDVINFTLEAENGYKSFNFEVREEKIEDIKEVQF